jgi:hypothetical protein
VFFVYSSCSSCLGFEWIARSDQVSTSDVNEDKITLCSSCILRVRRVLDFAVPRPPLTTHSTFDFYFGQENFTPIVRKTVAQKTNEPKEKTLDLPCDSGEE